MRNYCPPLRAAARTLGKAARPSAAGPIQPGSASPTALARVPGKAAPPTMPGRTLPRREARRGIAPWPWLCLILLAGSLPVRAAPDSLQAGARLADCASALRIGPVHCAPFGGGDVPATAAPETAFALPAADGAFEAQVDNYLQQYGKPPREAVRALLDPSDANIEHYLLKQQQMLAVVAYVAERMNRLQSTLAPAAAHGGADSAQDLPSFMQMRLTLVMHPDDPRAEAALQALRELALQQAALQAGVQWVQAPEATELRAAIARVPVPLVVYAPAAARDDEPEAPFVRIEDLRNGRCAYLDAQGLVRDRLRETVLALRRIAATPVAAAGALAGARP